MRRSIDDGITGTPSIEDEPDATAVSWAVGLTDDYDDAEPRVLLTVEEVGAAGTGLVAHLDPDTARRLRRAIGGALREMGEDPGT